MSTRGVIAIAQGDAWTGVYNISDSYPTWLGPRLWAYIQEHGYEALEQAVKAGINVISEDWEPEGEVFTSEMHDIQAMIEWVWIFSPHVLLVLTRATTTELRSSQRCQWIEPFTLIDLDGGEEKMGGHYYVHEPVGAFLLTDPEPDWPAIECGEQLERCHHYAWMHDRSVTPPSHYPPDVVEDSRRMYGV